MNRRGEEKVKQSKVSVTEDTDKINTSFRITQQLAPLISPSVGLQTVLWAI